MVGAYYPKATVSNLKHINGNTGKGSFSYDICAQAWSYSLEYASQINSHCVH